MRLILPFLIFCLCICLRAEAQQKFDCDGSSYISVIDAGQTSFYELTLSDIGIQQNVIADPFEANINAIGFNSKDSLIYGIDTEVNRLFRIWADGTVEGLQYIALEGDYFAGDIHPSGDRLVLLNADSLAFIYLDKMEIPVEYLAISTADSSGIFTTDIAYHPITNELFGYDGLQGKLISINDSTGFVDNTRYPSINFKDGLPALFFDPRGELYGIGNNNSNQESILFKFDLDSGMPSTSSYNSPMGDRDGCSCPYTVKLFQQVNNPILAPCTDMEVVLTISNLTNELLIDYTLFEIFPENYIISEIVHNPFVGDVTSGVGEDQFEMSGMEIPFGVDSIKLIISVPENAGGEEHSMQAELMGTNVNPNANSTFLSNDLLNTEKNSPTLIQINEVVDIFDAILPEVVELCEEDIFTLVLPASNDFTYEWSDGTDTLVRSFAESIELSLDVIGACKRETFDISIQKTQFTVSLGEDIYFDRGDLVTLVAEVNSLSPIDSFIWKTIDGEIPCDQCQSIQVLAKEDIKYLLVAINESGCVTTDEINLFVDRKLYMPNAFSPNGDGINDYFYLVSGFPNIEIKNMNIYDRWGGIVFSAENLTSNIETRGWNGIVNGKIAPTGNYFWTATIAVNENRDERLTGILMLQK